jgi:adenylate cyclase
MAEFGAPLPDADHAVNACLAALDMQRELAALRERFEAEGKPALYARIGISSGPMVIGNMGSSRIFDYTVMGDRVNLGSRLEGANKVYGTSIMCSGETRRLAGDAIITRALGGIRVKGKLTGVDVYEVIGRSVDSIPEDKRRVIALFHEGLDAWRERRWEDAAGLFGAALAIDPGDGPSAAYLSRCNECMCAPPGDEWDGVITMETK